MNKIKPLNLALGMVIAVVATSLFGTHLLSSLPKTNVISTSTKNNIINPSELKKDTLLSIQALNNSGCDNAVQLNDQKLLALPQQQFVTHHSWSKDAETFSGPLLQDVLNTACSNAQLIKLTALNDYAIDMDFAKVKKYQPIIALSVNGKRLSIREKGPLWLMLPLDKHEIRDGSLDGIMIWQLADIEILKASDDAS
jgi:hypothetical protein